MHTITSLDKKLAFGQFHRGGPARVDISSAKSHHDNQTYQLACITKLGTFWYFCVFFREHLVARSAKLWRSGEKYPGWSFEPDRDHNTHFGTARSEKCAECHCQIFLKMYQLWKNFEIALPHREKFRKRLSTRKTSYPFLLLEEVDPVPNAKVGIPGMAVRIRSDCGVHVEREHWPTNNIWAHFTSRLHGHR